MLGSITSCETYKPAVDDLGGNNNNTEIEPPVNGGEEEPEGTPFTASLKYNDIPFTAAVGAYVQWTDGYRYHTAEVDELGKATVYGLDGDYQVTVVNLPEGFAYNPAVHTATNDKTDIEIEIYKITPTKGSGEGLYRDQGCITMSGTGIYSATIEDENDIVYFEFQPSISGTYSIESWLDVNLAEINPKVDIYNGSFAFKVFSETRDDGGNSKGYTRNFRYDVELTADEIGSVFSFGIKATTKDGTYPVSVTFAITLNGDFYRDRIESEMVIPTELPTKLSDGRTKNDFANEAAFISAYIAEHEYSDSLYTFVGAETPLGGGRNIFDGTLYKFNEATGYYHRYYEETDTYGEILYVYITQPCRFIDKSFTHIEDDGNKALTVENGTKNYKFLIQGYSDLERIGYYWINQLAPAEKELYSSCLGYQGYANSDGLCAVTQELKDFLQGICISQRYFCDGDGWVEENDSVSVDAMEDDQWLFACGYYKAK